MTADRSANLARALSFLRSGNVASAIQILNQLLRTHPNDPAVLSLAGAAAIQLGDLKAATEILERAAAIDPRSAETRSNLGLAHLRFGNTGAAAEHLRAALAINPRLTPAAINLVFALIALGQLTEADAISRDLLVRAGNTPDTLHARAAVLAAGEDLEAAVTLFRQAIALAPNRADLHGSLASAYLAHGDRAQSLAEYTEAARLEPGHPTWRQGLASAGQASESTADIKVSLQRASEPGQRAGLAFALAKALEERSEYEEAFATYLEANRLKRSTFNYSVDETATIFDNVEHTFTADFVQARANAGHPDDAPIFIIGMPRSGTSLVEQILASHPEVHGAGELHLFRTTASEVAGAEAGNSLSSALAHMPANRFAIIGEKYADAARALAGGKPRIVDKLPGNFLFAGAIALALPNARIIHIRRDPMDNLVSIFRADFGSLHKHAYDLAELGDYYVRYRHLMQHWDDVLPAGRIYHLDYSALVTDQEGETRRLLAHCNLAWSDACLRFYETKRPVRTVSALQVKRPIFDDAIGSAARYGAGLDPLRALLARHGVATLSRTTERANS